MSMNINSAQQPDPNQASTSSAPSSAPAPVSRAPLSPLEQSELAENMARDKYNARERARDENFQKQFLESHDAILQGNADSSPAGQAAATTVATAATKAGSPQVPAALQNVVADRAPSTPAFGQLQELTSQSMSQPLYTSANTSDPKLIGTPIPGAGGPPLDGRQAYALAHETVKQMGILTPEQMAPFDAAAKKTLQDPKANINQLFPVNGAVAAGAAGAGVAGAGAIANAGGIGGAAGQRLATSSAPASDPAGGTNPSVGAPAGGAAQGPDASALNLIYNGSIQSVMMMVLSMSSKESAAEKQDAIGDLAKYSKISALLGDILTNQIGPAQQELNSKVADAKSSDSAKQTVTIKDYPTDISLTSLDPKNPEQLQIGGTKDIRCNTSEMTQLNAELTQRQTTLQNSQTIATNKINSRDSQVNNTMGQMSQILKVFNDTASQIGRNI